MPKKLFRRLIPTSPDGNPVLARWFGPIVNDPHLLHLNRHSVSTAFFIGIFCAFLPIPGQIFVVTGLALIFRCNLPISMLLIWISNPLTIPPLLIALYQLGQWMLGAPPSITTFEFNWTWLSENFSNIYLPTLLAGLSCGFVFGSISYFSVRMLWRWKVIREWEARKQRRKKPLPTPPP